MEKLNNKKTQQSRNYFPSIYRFITEQWILIAVSFLSGLIIIAIILQSLILQKNLQIEKNMISDREKTAVELNFWKSLLPKYKNYRDLDFKIANLEYKLGNIEEAKFYLKKSLELDPNFKKGREMEKQLGL